MIRYKILYWRVDQQQQPSLMCNTICYRAMEDIASKPRFTIKKWSAVALWSWDIAVDNCAICRNHIMDLCIECQAPDREPSSGNDDQCTIAWGACSHAFHLHCISKWLKTRHVCPLDNTHWDYATKETN